MSNTKNELATVKIIKLTMEVRIEASRTGLLPTLSDILPNTGEKITCMMENEAINKPILEGLAPKLDA